MYIVSSENNTIQSLPNFLDTMKSPYFYFLDCQKWYHSAPSKNNSLPLISFADEYSLEYMAL